MSAANRAANAQNKRKKAPQTAADDTDLISGLRVGDPIEVFFGNVQWWKACIHRKRQRPDGQMELQYRWSTRKTPPKNAWLATNDPALRLPPEATSRHLDNWTSRQGHVARDTWVADTLLADRWVDDDKQYLVRWAGYDAKHDSWEPESHILDETLVEAYEAEKAREAQAAKDGRRAAEQQAAAAAQEAARADRARFAQNFIDTMRMRMLAELERSTTTKHAEACVLVKPERCDHWEFLALQEYLAGLVPDGEDVSEHVTPVVQTKGARGAKMVTYEFHVRSHFMAGQFVDCRAHADRSEHVMYKRKGAGMVVALLPSFTFKRRGPRSEPTKIMTTITAGIGVLNGLSNDADWLLAKDANPTSDKVAIATRVLEIHRRKAGVVKPGIVRKCLALSR